ncbi:MAG: hypothetical protein OER43_19155 [Gammaproteobacteria bacterium]|nr:hypothetical protein [Gammaproteobacteria bacterium]
MKATAFILVLAGALAAGPVWAQLGTEVLEAKGRLNCHAIDKAKIGPALKDMAMKYKGKPGGEGELVVKLMEGKSCPKPNASEDEIREAVWQVLAAK